MVDTTGEFDQEYENIEFDDESLNVNKSESGPVDWNESAKIDSSKDFSDGKDKILSEDFCGDDLYDDVYNNSSDKVMAFLEKSHTKISDGNYSTLLFQ